MKLAASFVLASFTTIVACEDKKPEPTQTTSASMGVDNGAGDNTKRNEADKSGSTVTPLDQGNNPADLETTQKIRQALMGDDSLSSNAKNAKVITNNGTITLRGAVNTAMEKSVLETHARKVAGKNNVDNQLTIAAP